MMRPVRPHAWIRHAALLLLFVVGLAAFASPARAPARGERHGASVVAVHAVSRMVAVRGGEPESPREAASPALAGAGSVALPPAGVMRLALDARTTSSPPDLSSPPPNARGPPPSA